MAALTVSVPRLLPPLACLALCLGGAIAVPVSGQTPKPQSKILYVLPYYPQYGSQTTTAFTADVAELRQRLGEGTYVRVGFNRYIQVPMTRWNVSTTDRTAIRAELAPVADDIAGAVTRARDHNIPLSLSMLTAIRSRYDPVQTEAEREDRRNTQWYANGDIAPGWVTHSRYARKLRARLEAYLREVGAILAAQMVRAPATLVAASGDGEVELSFDRSPPFSTSHTAASLEVTDYSPFAIAEFRDWLRNAGLYATGQPFEGQGYAQAARYQGDASPGTDTNGDGRTLNGDFGTAFTTWSLRHFDWSLTDAVEVDSQAIAALVYDRPGFNALPGTDAARFDAPRVRTPGHPWWDVFDLFRQTMIWHYNRDVARWITTTADPESGRTVPTDRWFSHQVPADYLFGNSPQNPDLRFITSASPHWSADVSPYGGLGITAFTVNLGGGVFARTLPAVIPHVAARGVRWAILEWNPSLPASNSLDIYADEMTIIERYRPTLVVPWAWGDAFYQVRNSPFEIALRDLIARIKDRPPAPPPAGDARPAGAAHPLSPPQLRKLREVLASFPLRDPWRDSQPARRERRP